MVFSLYEMSFVLYKMFGVLVTLMLFSLSINCEHFTTHFTVVINT